MTDYQKSKVKGSLQESKEILENFFLIFPEEGTLERITKRLTYLKNTCELQGKQSPIVIIDYLQFIQGNKRKDTQSLIKRIQRTFKKYAIDNNSIVFLLIANNRTFCTRKANVFI